MKKNRMPARYNEIMASTPEVIKRPSGESLKWAMARWQNGNTELSYAFGVAQLAQALDIVVRELNFQMLPPIKKPCVHHGPDCIMAGTKGHPRAFAKSEP